MPGQLLDVGDLRVSDGYQIRWKMWVMLSNANYKMFVREKCLVKKGFSWKYLLKAEHLRSFRLVCLTVSSLGRLSKQEAVFLV